MKRAFAALAVTLIALFMAGCSTTRLVETDVSAFYRWSGAPPVPGTLYRFERLPSQAVGTQQDALESQARTALARVGMTLDPGAARFGVQVQLGTLLIERGPYRDGSFGGFGWGGAGIFLGGGSRGASLGVSLPLRFSEPAYYRRELTLLMRDLASSQIVFETRALSDSVQDDLPLALPAMLDAALRGFPQPPAGTRRITTEVTPQSRPAP